jgi:hypothetical protein
MQSGIRRPLLARVLVLLALLVVASLALTHCRMIGDSMNGVNADLFKRKDECLARCQSDFQKRNQAEDRLHEQNLAACGSNTACLNAENARHQAAQQNSKQQRDACINGCHQQGGGSSGP